MDFKLAKAIANASRKSENGTVWNNYYRVFGKEDAVEVLASWAVGKPDATKFAVVYSDGSVELNLEIYNTTGVYVIDHWLPAGLKIRKDIKGQWRVGDYLYRPGLRWYPDGIPKGEGVELSPQPEFLYEAKPVVRRKMSKKENHVNKLVSELRKQVVSRARMLDIKLQDFYPNDWKSRKFFRHTVTGSQLRTWLLNPLDITPNEVYAIMKASIAPDAGHLESRKLRVCDTHRQAFDRVINHYRPTLYAMSKWGE